MQSLTLTGAVAAFCLLAVALVAPAQSQGGAQDYPQRPIRLVVGYAPGGSTDIFSRILGSHMTQNWGQQVVVDNRSGASAQIATDIVAKAPPDGYTLLVTPSGTHTANVSLFKKLPYDTVKDFAPVTLFGWVTNMIVTHPSTPVSTLQELIQLAKSKPGELTYATSSAGSVGHLSAELLNSLAGIKIVHVPYKGGGPALTAIASNEISIMFAALPSASPFIQAKRIKPIAVTSPKRSPVLPDVPTVAESGLPGLAVREWYGVLAPAKTPVAVIDKLNAEIVRIIRKPEVEARFAELGTDVVGNTPREFAKQIDSDIRMWAKVIKEAGIQGN